MSEANGNIAHGIDIVNIAETPAEAAQGHHYARGARRLS
jgi:hypothetical protein